MPKKHPHVVIDTNVFLNNPRIIFERSEEIFIPTTVLQELDKHKGDPGETGRNCRHAIRSIYENIQSITLHKSDIYEGTNDEKIIESALQINATVLTGDILMYLLAKSRGVKAEFYEDKVKVANDTFYKGIQDCRGEEVNEEDFNENEFALASDGIYRKTEGKLKRLGKDKEAFGLRHKNVEQRCALELLLDDDIKLVTITGAAGGGKTAITLGAAMQKVVSENKYKQIMLSKATIALGNHDIGFLPGTELEKTLPWMGSYIDNLENLFGREQDPKKLVENLIEDGIVKIEPLAYIRGRSIKDTLMIVDECQNLTEHEMKSIVTRAGEGTKIIFLGDLTQIDHPKLDEFRNGLACIVNAFKEEKIAGHINLEKSERSELANIAVKVLK